MSEYLCIRKRTAINHLPRRQRGLSNIYLCLVQSGRYYSFKFAPVTEQISTVCTTVLGGVVLVSFVSECVKIV